MRYSDVGCAAETLRQTGALRAAYRVAVTLGVGCALLPGVALADGDHRTVRIQDPGNPAMSPASEARFAFGSPLRAGIRVEIGDIDDDLFDEIDDTVDALEALEDEFNDFEGSGSHSDLEDLVDQAFATEASIADVLGRLDDDARFRVAAEAGFPFGPATFNAPFSEGRLAIDASFGAMAAGRAVGEDDFTFGVPPESDFAHEGGEIEDYQMDGSTVQWLDEDGNVVDETKLDLGDSGAMVSVGTHAQLGMAYSHPVSLDHLDWGVISEGDFHVGARVSVHSVELGRVVEAFEDEDFDDAVTENLSETTDARQRPGIDVGAAWFSPGGSVRLGGEVRNLTEPSWDYPDPCNGDARCQAVYDASDEPDSFTLERQFAVDATYLYHNGRGAVRGYADLNAITDMVGYDEQFVGVETVYQPVGRWWPAPRAGIQKNLAGEGLTRVKAGVTFFGVVGLEGFMALERVQIDGDSVPREMGVSLGMNTRF